MDRSAREILEEAGLKVSARRLYSVRHKAKRPYEPDARDFYKLFFLCERADTAAPRAGSETSDARFFRRDRLPELSLARVIESDIEAAFASQRGELQAASFD